ncbi:MAG TPA: adenylate/guanylate cyclase domain-containing protein [Kofleriaceae bacterium]|nr:adenylate/guanylate cyclase domain-containing protein [Kofleriaceae bacterium]
MTFQETKLVLLAADLAGFTRAAEQLAPLEVAALLDGWYRAIEAILGRHGGRVVKYMGDGCFATFPAGACAAATDAAAELWALDRGATSGLAVGVNVHLGTVAEGEVAVGADRRYDVFGGAVNHLFRMGGAGRLQISEAVYRELPEERRGQWQAQPGSATYAPAR